MSTAQSARRSARVLRATAATACLMLVPTAAVAAPPRVAGTELEPGVHEFSVEIDGHSRTGVVLLPQSWTPRANLPLVVNLHGSRSDGAEQLVWSDAAELAEEEGYVVVLPDGGIENPGDGWLWNVPGVTDAPAGSPDDVAFLRDLVEWASDELGTSEENVFATGYSGGGRLISQAACDDPTLFRAVAPVTGLRAGFPVQDETGTWVPDPSSCAPEAVTPIVTFVGTVDPVNPLDGGGAAYWQYGHEAALARWAEIGGYTSVEVSEPAPGVTLTTIGDGRGANEIESWSVDGAGHVWPGSPAFEHETSWAGTPTYAVNANEVMRNFFEEHSVDRHFVDGRGKVNGDGNGHRPGTPGHGDGRPGNGVGHAYGPATGGR